jgi:hypothetical protein
MEQKIYRRLNLTLGVATPVSASVGRLDAALLRRVAGKVVWTLIHTETLAR